jgi:hypothetical protein
LPSPPNLYKEEYMNKFTNFFAVAAAILLLNPVAACAAPTSTTKNNLTVSGNLIVGGTSTVAGTQTFTGNAAVGGNLAVTGTTTLTGAATLTAKPTLTTASVSANGDTITIQDLGDANFVQTEGTQTINGAKTFGTAPTITGGLTAANIQSGSAKRQVIRAQLSPVTAAAADSTTYAGLVAFGRAGTVKKISFVCTVAPTVGTDTIEVLKNNTTTMLNAATYDANTLTALTVANATLTATGADLALTATDVIRCKYNAGSQTADAQDVTVIIEFEPTDF